MKYHYLTFIERVNYRCCTILDKFLFDTPSDYGGVKSDGGNDTVILFDSHPQWIKIG